MIIKIPALILFEARIQTLSLQVMDDKQDYETVQVP